MTHLEYTFDITESQQCPIYKKGDCFELNGVRVIPPPKKDVCVFPIKVIAEVFEQLKVAIADSTSNEIVGKEFDCGGCTSGLIRFICSEKEDAWVTPLFRMEREYEARKAMEKKIIAYEGQLKEFSVLSGFDETSLKDIVSCATMQDFPVGYTLLKIDTPGKNLYLILSGRVILLDRQGETIGYHGKGEIVGEMSLMFDRLTNVTVKVEEPVKALVINEKDFNQLLLKFPFMKMAITRLIAKRLSNANKPDSDGEQSPGVRGGLKELPSPELFQMIHENMKSGTVELTLPGGPARVDFCDGEIVDSTYQDKSGQEAFYSIVMEREGSFVFTNTQSDSENERQPIGGFMSMLMEGLRLLDEREDAASQQQSAEAGAG